MTRRQRSTLRCALKPSVASATPRLSAVHYCCRLRVDSCRRDRPAPERHPAPRRAARHRRRRHVHRGEPERRPGGDAYYPGITVAKTEVLNKDALRVTLKIAADCRLGEHAFRVRTASGVSELRTFWVGALPAVDEKEPNTQFDSPQPIALNTTVHGVVDNEDVDYYVVECKKGQRLSVEVEGMRLAGPRSSTRTSPSSTRSGSSWPSATTPR